MAGYHHAPSHPLKHCSSKPICNAIWHNYRPWVKLFNIFFLNFHFCIKKFHNTCNIKYKHTQWYMVSINQHKSSPISYLIFISNASGRCLNHHRRFTNSMYIPLQVILPSWRIMSQLQASMACFAELQFLRTLISIIRLGPVLLILACNEENMVMKLWLGGGHSTNLLRLFLPFFENRQNTDYLLNITFLFDRCHCSWAAVIPVKYECDSNDLTHILSNVPHGVNNQQGF